MKQTPMLQRKARYIVETGDWVLNELFTQREIDKLKAIGVLIPKSLQAVEIPKYQTYWFFGCRFADLDYKRKFNQKKKEAKQ
jgi:hypothetical protein